MFFFKGGDMFKRKILSPIKAIYIIFDSMPLGVNQKINITNISRINENIVYLINGIKSDDKKTINHFINDITYFCLNEDKEGNSITEKIVHYLQDNFNKAVTLDELSEVFNMSKQWLITLFKKEKGIAPITYLNNYRMKKAKEFLLNQEMNVAEISVACGFETQYYFSNTFKKAFGVSPTTWRKDMLL
jgi:AraC-like DNA-binding protein